MSKFYASEMEEVSIAAIKAFYVRNDASIRKALSPLVGNDYTKENGFPKLRDSVAKWAGRVVLPCVGNGVVLYREVDVCVRFIESFAGLTKNPAFKEDPLAELSKHFSLKANSIIIRFLTQWLGVSDAPKKAKTLWMVLDAVDLLAAIAEKTKDESIKL